MVIASGKRVASPKPVWNATVQGDKLVTLNLMVAGATGQGKSTFINNLLYEFSGQNIPCGDATSREDWLKDPTNFRHTTTPRENDTANGYEQVSYTVQDTPGYGDGYNVEEQVFDIVNYVIQLQYDYHAQEMDNVPTDDIKDFRIDACLFFINPHRFQDNDLSFLRELSKVANIVPIIAKADSMTREELHAYKSKIWNDIKVKGGTELYENMLSTENLFKTHGFSKLVEQDKLKYHHMTVDGVMRTNPGDPACEGVLSPFGVICHNAANRSVKTFEPRRAYPWGTAEAFNCEHCDFYFLKFLLLKGSFGNLKKRTRNIYEQYVKRLKGRFFLKRWFHAFRTTFIGTTRTSANLPFNKPPAKRRQIENATDTTPSPKRQKN